MKRLTIVLLLLGYLGYSQCPRVNLINEENTLTLQLFQNKPMKLGDKMIVAFSDLYVAEIFEFNDYFRLGGKYIATFSTEINKEFPWNEEITLFFNGGVCFCEPNIFIGESNIDYDYDYSTNSLTIANSDYIKIYDEHGNFLYGVREEVLDLSFLIEKNTYFLETSLSNELIKVIL